MLASRLTLRTEYRRLGRARSLRGELGTGRVRQPLAFGKIDMRSAFESGPVLAA